NKLVLWGDDGDGYQQLSAFVFTAVASGTTYCELYGPYSPYPLVGHLPQRPAAEAMPERWRFTVAGCCNLEAGNCECLNGEWVVARQGRGAAGHHWVKALNYSFADPKQPCFWRLTFNDRDG